MLTCFIYERNNKICFPNYDAHALYCRSAAARTGRTQEERLTLIGWKSQHSRYDILIKEKQQQRERKRKREIIIKILVYH